MKRVLLATTTTDADGGIVPAGVDTYSCITLLGNRMLLVATLPDGTARTANTIADFVFAQDGTVDVETATITSAQRTAIKTFLTNAGMDVSQFDGDNIQDRRQLLRFALRRLARMQDKSARELLDGWDAG
jgi:hypothetical protein